MEQSSIGRRQIREIYHRGVQNFKGPASVTQMFMHSKRHELGERAERDGGAGQLRMQKVIDPV